MKKQTLTLIVAGLTLAFLLSCETGLAKAEHHENLGRQIEAELAQIEADALMEHFNKLTQRILQLELEQVSLEVETETAQGEEELAELKQHLRRTQITKDRIHHLRDETRGRLGHIAEELAHRPREHGKKHNHVEEREHTPAGEYHRESAEFEERVHQMKRQIDELREAGRHDRADLLQREFEEQLLAHRKYNQHRRREGHAELEHGHAELRQHLEHLLAERRKALTHLEELTVAARQVEGDGEEAQAKRHRHEDRAAEVKVHLSKLNGQLEELEHALEASHRGEQRNRVEREERGRREDGLREREE
ncbi:MAG: hypothetical protein VX392_07915 [Verrucomicrobiota bacterium]|nr:hypothetical protein [Verrucomicrobiota bacterium]